MNDEYQAATERLLNKFRQPGQTRESATTTATTETTVNHVTINRPTGCVIVLGTSLSFEAIKRLQGGGP